MSWLDSPIGMVRYDELLNFLLTLWLSGGAHEPTLNLVAQNYGLLDHFETGKRRLSGIITERPILPKPAVQP